MGHDDDDDPITSCVITAEEAPPAFEKPFSQNQTLGIHSYCDTAATRATMGADGEFIGVHLEDWRPVFYAGSTAATDDGKRQAFHQARRGLLSRGAMTVNNDVYRITLSDVMVQERMFKRDDGAKNERAQMAPEKTAKVAKRDKPKRAKKTAKTRASASAAGKRDGVTVA